MAAGAGRGAAAGRGRAGARRAGAVRRAGRPQRLLYARVDLLPGPAGDPQVVEVELTEPSLFLTAVPPAADRFAAAIRHAVS